MAIILTLPIWFAVNLILSPFRAHKEEKEKGSWSGNRFNYNSPLLIHTHHITPSDNEAFKTIKIREAEKNSFCLFKFEYDGGIAEATVNIHQNNFCFWEMFDKNNQQVGVRITKNKETKMIFKCPQDSDQTTVRLYLLYWEK